MRYGLRSKWLEIEGWSATLRRGTNLLVPPPSWKPSKGDVRGKFDLHPQPSWTPEVLQKSQVLMHR
jgi:hypothetical protein